MTNRVFFLFCICVGVMACENNDDFIALNREQRLNPLHDYIVRVAEEGIAMLENTSTRSNYRAIDIDRIKPYVSTQTRSGELDTLYYVVNFVDSTGFALVAADSTSPMPLLVATEKGNYTPGELTNTGFDDYITLLNNHIGDKMITPRQIIVEPDSTSMIVVDTLIVDSYSNWISFGPYINVKWGQGKLVSFNPNFPYNRFCFDNEGKICSAGCAPIAIAQIMTFHRYPAEYNVTFMNNAYRSINWDLMNSYIGGVYYSWPQSGINDVPILIREIGERAQTTYYNHGEATTMSNQIRPCFASFGYTATDPISYIRYNVLSELSHRPILMSGENSSGKGHAWVADGYKSRDRITQVFYVYSDGRQELASETTLSQQYIHMNWGGDGYNNGYFAEGVYNLSAGVQYDNPYTNSAIGNYNISVKYHKILNNN